MVVGWQITDHMRTSLVIDALEMARLHGHLQPDAIVHHDRGTQYASSAYATFCTASGVRVSMGRTGVCWDCQSVCAGSSVDSEVLTSAA